MQTTEISLPLLNLNILHYFYAVKIHILKLNDTEI